MSPIGKCLLVSVLALGAAAPMGAASAQEDELLKSEKIMERLFGITIDPARSGRQFSRKAIAAILGRDILEDYAEMLSPTSFSQHMTFSVGTGSTF